MPEVTIRRCEAADVEFARALMEAVNRELAPASHAAEFERYIEKAGIEYSGLIERFAPDRGNGFWIVRCDRQPVGTFGLERVSADEVELRRMYLARPLRRRGLGTAMLIRAEREAAAMGYATLVLWTSELQQAAIAFYRSRGFTLADERIEGEMSGKTVGSGFVRYRYQKQVGTGRRCKARPVIAE